MTENLEDLPRVDILEMLTVLFISKRSAKSLSEIVTIDFYIKRLNQILSTKL